MDCHRPSAFAMMNGAKDGKFFLFLVFALTYYGLWILLLRSQWWKKELSLQRPPYPHCHCKSCFCNSWQSRYGVQFHSQNAFIFVLFLFFLFTDNKFFLFSVFIFTISGLWGFASLCKGGCCEATGGLREKLKIEAQSGKMICLHNHFSLSSHEVRNEENDMLA